MYSRLDKTSAGASVGHARISAEMVLPRESLGPDQISRGSVLSSDSLSDLG